MDIHLFTDIKTQCTKIVDVKQEIDGKFGFQHIPFIFQSWSSDGEVQGHGAARTELRTALDLTAAYEDAGVGAPQPRPNHRISVDIMNTLNTSYEEYITYSNIKKI